MTPDYEKQALGATIMESIQTILGLRAQTYALQAEIERLKAEAAKPAVPMPEAAKPDVPMPAAPMPDVPISAAPSSAP